MRMRLIMFVLALTLGPAVAFATMRAARGAEVSFTAVASAGLTIVGTTGDLELVDDGQNITIRVPLKRLTTGIDLRDRHLRDHLDVRHHSTAELTVPRSALTFPSNQAVDGRTRGTLKVHGQARPVTFQYHAVQRRGAIVVDGTLRMDMTKFGIEPPRYMGLSVRPQVDVRARFTVQGE